FLAAAGLMFAFTSWRRGLGVLRIKPRELAACAVVGGLLPGANAVLFVAERHVPTGLAALIIGAVPLWLVVLRVLSGDQPPRAALVGVVIGGGSSDMWAGGSFLSGKLPLPKDSFAATAYEMLCGGLILLPIGLATTHPHFSQFSARSIGG